MSGPTWLAYRLQLFKPRSVDPTEAALLVPIGGAHSDNFDVATISGVAGVQPYLCLPQGNNGSLDPVNKNVTTGTRTVSVGDQPLTTAQPPTQAWVTAFLGDAAGRNRLKGCKAILYEQTTAGGAWNAIFTGRVGNVSLDGKLKLSLELKSSVDDLNRKKVFLYDPHPSATEAFRSAIFPPRLVRSWASGAIPAGPWLSATVSGKTTDANGVTHGFLDLSTAGEDLHYAALVTRQGAPFSAGLAPGSVFLKVTAGGATGLFRVPRHSLAYTRTSNKKGTPRRYLTRIGQIDELPSGHPLHMAVPANGTAVTCYVQGNDRTVVSSEAPLFIDDIHPLKLWGYILDGYFGVMDDNGNARPIAPRDTSAAGPWDYTNAASPSFSMSELPLIRFLITKPEKTNDWIIANICQPFNLSYRVDGQGRVIPLDLRPTSATPMSGAVTDADLTELPIDWTVDGSKALLGVNASYYIDIPRQIAPQDLYDNSPDAFPDIAVAAQIDSVQQQWLVVNPLLDIARDAGDAVATIDAQGIRITEHEFTDGTAGTPQQPGKKLSAMTKAQQDTLAPYAGGAVTVPLSFSRDSAFATSGHEGQFWTITVSTLPDPATNQRGGPRVGLCLSKVEQGLKILATFLDVGSATPAAVPTIGALTITNGGLNVPITVNAASDPVQAEFIVTPAGTGARPAATDSGWRLIGEELRLHFVSITKRQENVPANTRLWVRARSRPMGSGLKLPSAYVFPAGGAPVGSIDVTAITAPTIAAATGITGNRATVPWTNGDATIPVEVFYNAGGIPGGGWTDAMRVQPTPSAGSTSVELRNLTPSTTYGVAVRHRDGVGGTSAFSATTFATTGTRKTALLVPPLGIGGGGSSGTGIDVAPLTPAQRYVPVGVSLLLTAADPAMQFEIQHAPDSAGAPNVGAATTIATTIPATQRSYHDPQPLDGALHWYRHRHVGYGDTAGAWSGWVSATAIVQRAEGPADSLATPLNSQNRHRCRIKNSATQSITASTTTSVTFDSEDYDLGDLHDTAVNPTHITIPAGLGGQPWTLLAIVSWANNTDTTQRLMSFFKNGALLVDGPRQAAVNGNTTKQAFTWIDIPNDGDYYELKVWHNAAGAVNLDIDTKFSAIASW